MDTSRSDQEKVCNWTGIPGCIPEGEVAHVGPGINGVQFFKEDPEAFVKYSYHLSSTGELVQVTRPLLGGTWNNFNGDLDATRRYLIAVKLREQKEKEAAEYLEKLRAEDAATKLANTQIKEAKEAANLRLQEKRRLAAARRRSSIECPSSSSSKAAPPICCSKYPHGSFLKKKKK